MNTDTSRKGVYLLEMSTAQMAFKFEIFLNNVLQIFARKIFV
jgi:hypothetical protein